MNKKNWWKFTLFFLLLISFISVPIILYYTTDRHNSASVNLNEQNVTYLADVEHLNNINGEEATRIRSGIGSAIIIKMNSLNLEINVDYIINNLNNIQNGVDLDHIAAINVDSVETSTKATGNFDLTLNVREDITNRSISSKSIPISEENDLSALTADNIIRNIRVELQILLNIGQTNREGEDYQITNINLIQPGAVFNDYKDAISVDPISSSTHLKGTFKITFLLQ